LNINENNDTLQAKKTSVRSSQELKAMECAGGTQALREDMPSPE